MYSEDWDALIYVFQLRFYFVWAANAGSGEIAYMRLCIRLYCFQSRGTATENGSNCTTTAEEGRPTWLKEESSSARYSLTAGRQKKELKRWMRRVLMCRHCLQFRSCSPTGWVDRSRGYKTVFMLNITEHEFQLLIKTKILTNKEVYYFKSLRRCIYHANKC